VSSISCTSPCTCSSKSPSLTCFVAIFLSRCLIANPALAARAFWKGLSFLDFHDPCRLTHPESLILARIPRSDPGGFGHPVPLGTLSEWIGPSMLELPEGLVIHSNGCAASLPDTSIGSPLVIRGKREIRLVFRMSNLIMSCS